jgi:hypothetical protein
MCAGSIVTGWTGSWGSNLSARQRTRAVKRAARAIAVDAIQTVAVGFWIPDARHRSGHNLHVALLGWAARLLDVGNRREPARLRDDVPSKG